MVLAPCPNSSGINGNHWNNWTFRICLGATLPFLAFGLCIVSSPFRFCLDYSVRTNFAIFMVCEIPTCELNHSSTIHIASSSFLLVFSVALAGISLFGKVNSCCTDWLPTKQWCSDSKGSMFCSMPSTPMSRSPPINLQLPRGRLGTTISSSGVRFQVAHEVLSCVFSLVYCLSYWDPSKSPKNYTFRYPITFWAFVNLIFRLVLLSSCPSQSHIVGLGRVLDLFWVLHLVI
jgi:hypothetical protein